MEAHVIGYTTAGPQATRANAPSGNGDLFQTLLRETAQRAEADAPLPRRDAPEARDARDVEPANRARAAEMPEGEAAHGPSDTADERLGTERNAAPSRQPTADDPAEAEAGIAAPGAKPERPDQSNRDGQRAEAPSDAARQPAQSDTDTGSPAGTANESAAAPANGAPHEPDGPARPPSFAAQVAALGQSASASEGLVPATARAAAPAQQALATTPAASNVTGPANASAGVKSDAAFTTAVPGAAAPTAGGPPQPAAGPDGAASSGADDGDPARPATTHAGGRAVAASAGANPQAAGAQPNRSADPQAAQQPVPPGDAIRAAPAQTGQTADGNGTSRPALVPGNRPGATVSLTGAHPASGGAEPTPDADAAPVTQVRAPGSTTAQTAPTRQPVATPAGANPATTAPTPDGIEANTAAGPAEHHLGAGRLADKAPSQTAPAPSTGNGRAADTAAPAGTPPTLPEAASNALVTGSDRGLAKSPEQTGDPFGRLPAAIAGIGAGQSGGPSTIGQGAQARGVGMAVHIDEVAVHIQRAAARGEDRIRIRLHPAELGQIDVRLKVGSDGLVKVVVSIERPETFDLMQRDARGLERALQDAGLKTDSGSLSFNLRGDGHDGFGDRHERAEGSAARPGQTDTAAPEPAPRAEYVPVLSDRAVDIRV